MWWKVIRLILLIGITLFALWVSRTTYHVTYDLLDFQVTLYKHLITTQQQIGNVKNTVSESFNALLTTFWWGNEGKAALLWSDVFLVADRVSAFSSKLKIITLVISSLVGVCVRKMLFDTLFGIKTLLQQLNSFIHKPLHS